MRSLKQFEQVRQWATDRGLYAFGDLKSQTIKLGEEYGELCRGIMKQDQDEIKDALGDMLVVLINASHLAGYKLEDCLDSAWEVIKDRKGKMDGGTFVKEDELEIKTKCSSCGMDFSGVTGYVCQRLSCPMGLNGPSSSVVEK